MTQALQQSENDKRLYRYICLPNGLKAVLISDPETRVNSTDEEADDGEEESVDEDGDTDDSEEEVGEEEDCQEQHIKKAAAALAVGVGSFCDPVDVQGLSHYLEHMLFMGSEKYPDENEYDSFLARHGGSSNAFTEMEYTNYHFDVKPEKLHGALDRFAQFFVEPLCKAEALEREVQAVNNEFVGVKQNDSCRLAQLRCHTAQEGHLYRKFTWGNRKSLIEQPAAAGIDVRQRLMEYYKNQYSAERMALAVLGGQSLDTLEAWVRELFSHVPSGRGARPTFDGMPRPYKGARLCLVPAVKQAHDLVITFQLPSLADEYLAKAEDYLSSLIGHEGRGSLLSALKARGWATGLSAGVPEGGYERNTGLYLFDISVTLTEPGLQAGAGMGLAVVGLLFEYLAMLREKGPQQWVYQELADIGAMKSRFIEEDDATEHVTNVASNVHCVRTEHILLSEFIYKDWRPNLVTALLEEMVPSKVRVDIQTSDFERLRDGCAAFPNSETSTEPWFELPYVTASIPTELLREWEGAGSSVCPELDLPPRNEFIPTDFLLRCEEGPRAAGGMSPDLRGPAKRQKQAAEGGGGPAHGGPHLHVHGPSPRGLLDKPGLRLWHRLDDAFKTPRAAAYFQLATPASYASPRAAAATHLALRLLQDALCETTYMADVAGLQYDIWPEGRNGVELKLDGFSHKLPLLTVAVVQSLASFKVDEDSFGRVKEALLRKYRNANMNVDRHATYLRLRALKHIWEVDEVLAELERLQPSHIQDFLPELLAQTYIEALVEGNVTAEAAARLAESLRELLPSRLLSAAERPEDRVAQIPSGSSTLIRLPAKNAEEDNSAAEVYFQCGLDSLELRATLDLLEQIAAEPCFNSLRTQQQLGYSVSCGILLTHNILGFAFVILSGSHAPSHLDARIEAFLVAFEAELAALPTEEFQRNREAVIAAKLQKDRSLQDQADRHWEQITSHRYRFQAREEEVEVLERLKKEQLLQCFRKHLLPGSAVRARLAVHVVGRSQAADLAAAVSDGVSLVTDPEQLRANLAQFPPPQPAVVP